MEEKKISPEGIPILSLHACTHTGPKYTRTHKHTHTQAGPTDAFINGGEQSGQMVAT